jgi:hypothetical protein
MKQENIISIPFTSEIEIMQESACSKNNQALEGRQSWHHHI